MSRPGMIHGNKIYEQAGAELCQAQERLGLAKIALFHLPKVKIVFQLPTNLGLLIYLSI